MPTYIQIEDAKVQDLSRYYDLMIYFVDSVKYWPRDSIELKEFLDSRGRVVEPYPQEFKDFIGNWEEVKCASNTVGVRQPALSIQGIRLLAGNLYWNEDRRKYYLSYLKYRVREIIQRPKFVSISELEERFQYHNYTRQCKLLKLSPEYSFERWRKTDACKTFFDFVL